MPLSELKTRAPHCGVIQPGQVKVGHPHLAFPPSTFTTHTVVGGRFLILPAPSTTSQTRNTSSLLSREGLFSFVLYSEFYPFVGGIDNALALTPAHSFLPNPPNTRYCYSCYSCCCCCCSLEEIFEITVALHSKQDAHSSYG